MSRPGWTLADYWFVGKEFGKELGHQAWEHKWEILLTVAAGPLGKVLSEGRCFWLIVCFTAGTEVWTAQGPKNIEDIKPGEQVWSYNAEQQRWELCEVLATSERDYDGRIVHLEIENDNGECETIECTETHPFWVVADDAANEQLVPTDQQVGCAHS